MAIIKDIEQLIAASYKSLESVIIKFNTDINLRLDTIESSLNVVSTRLLVLENQMINSDIKINDNVEEIKATNGQLKDLSEKIVHLKTLMRIQESEMEKLDNKIDEQLDHNMRETLVISGIPGAEKDWEATKKLLARYIEELSDYKLDKNKIYNSIAQAHRGNKDAIFVKFSNNLILQDVKGLNFRRKNVYINQLRSPIVAGQIKKALIERKALQEGEGAKWKMFVNDNVQLMVKRPGEDRYTRYKQF